MAKNITPAIIRMNKRREKKRYLKYSPLQDAWLRFRRNPTAIIGLGLIVLIILIAIFASVISPYDPYLSTPDYNQAPSASHLFGTDHIGRDLFSRCMYGARWSLPIGFVAMLLALLGGGVLGIVAAFFGKGADVAIMRVMDVLQAIPGVLLAIIIVAALGSGTIQLMVALFVSTMPSMSRTFRAAIFTVRGNEYIQAARCIGSRNVRLVLRHLLPNAAGHVIIFTVHSISAGIMTVATLSYIGLGVKTPYPEWGSLLSTGKDYISSYPHMTIFPGLMIMITVLAFNLFGDGLRDALDPRLK